MSRYVFFDRSLDVLLPPSLQTQWDLLYGAFRGESAASPDVYVRCSAEGVDGVTLDIGGQTRAVRREDVLVHLQDLIQNHVLPSVQSRLLWHGAAWCVDGGAVLILGDSGLGKTTLSLAEQAHGGQVLSDEIAAYDPETMQLEPFPRAMAVRPDTLFLLNVRHPYARLRMDEEKAVIPLASGPGAVPLHAVVILEWPADEEVLANEQVCELNVLAVNKQWQCTLSEAMGGVEYSVHPDGQGWWRCRTPNAIPASMLESAVRSGGGVLAGFHRGAHRVPDYATSPSVTPLTADEAAQRALCELVNARTWLGTIGATHLLGVVRAACREARCVLCTPGRIDETRLAFRSL